jgi:hypothetical protein
MLIARWVVLTAAVIWTNQQTTGFVTRSFLLHFSTDVEGSRVSVSSSSMICGSEARLLKHKGRYRSCRTNRCSSLFLSRTAALLAILPSSHGFCCASGLAASHTHVACHPPLRTEDAFE